MLPNVREPTPLLNRFAIFASFALVGCSVGDPLDHKLPADTAAQEAIVPTLAEPARSHYRTYLTDVRRSDAAGSKPSPTLRQAIALGRERASEQVLEVTQMRDSLVAAQVQQARQQCSQEAELRECLARRDRELATQGVPQQFRARLWQGNATRPVSAPVDQ